MKLTLAAVLVLLSAYTEAARYLGCFKDTGDRALRGQQTHDVMMTNKMCVLRCQKQGFKYAATQAGSHCFCGSASDDYKRHGEKPNGCISDCSGKKAEVCGGSWANSVYEIETPLLDMVGCFADKADRAMEGWWFDSPVMTPRICIAVCKEKGWKFAGLQAGAHCFCGNQYDKYGEAKDRCKSACTGHRTHVCGGGWANQVFRTEADGVVKTPEIKPVALGCFRDAGVRALDALWTKSSKMTNEMCNAICNARGHKYAATQAGAHCFCGDYKYDRYGYMTNCNSKCPGDAGKTCGGGWANQVVQLVGEPEAKFEVESKGCFLDKGARAVDGFFFNGAYMTRDICIEQCGEMGFAYAANQAGTWCFCGNEYDKYGSYDKCVSKCPGNAEQTCGGPWANEVFEIKNPKQLMIGCYVDKGERAMRGLWFDSAQMTVDLCVSTCKAKGFMYAGLQAGSHCFCDNEYARYGAGLPTQCRSACSGNKIQACGGGWRNMVYKTGASGETKGIAAPASLYLGCYKDSGARALSKLFLHSKAMTPILCMKVCAVVGAKYAATQAAEYCFCGDSTYDRYGEVSNCNSYCAGDIDQFCGGGWANSVYQIGGFHTVPQTCAAQREIFSHNNLPVTPKFTTACRFKPKQCNDKGDKCWCVHPETGQITSDGAIDKSTKCERSTYIGCFKDTGDRALSGPFVNHRTMTIGLCVDICRKQGLPYAGLQASTWCFCGEEYDKHGEAENCDKPCSGLSEEICGGSWANSVYAVENLELDRVGCYEDKADRAMTGLWFDSARMTPQMCVRSCGFLGFEYAGLQAGSHCFCGDSYDKYGERLNACRQACSGDSQQACGSGWSNLVFKTAGTSIVAEEEELAASYVGCYRDSGTRALTKAWLHSKQMTRDLCNKFCRVQGTKYAATQASEHCFCGDDYDRYGPITNCNLKCRGDDTITCGGGWANEVYQIAGKEEKAVKVKDLGCWKDTGDRALDGQWSNGNYMNNAYCHQICAEQGYKYAATQAGQYCFCGNAYDKHGPSEGCNTPCVADADSTCGGSWANQVVEILDEPAQKMVGCFRDTADRAMTGVWFDSQQMTIELCVDSCKGLGFKYAGLQAGAHCFCGNEYDKHGAFPKRCTSACSGNNKNNCGGGWANMVYETGADGNTNSANPAESISLGCYRDSGSRDLTGLWFKSNEMTTQLCQKVCAVKGYKYAANQAGAHCFCGNEYGRYGKAWNCNSLCTGDRRDFCGGGWANMVYQVGEHASYVEIEKKTTVKIEKTTTAAPEVPCEAEKEAFAENQLGIEPVFEDEETCTFAPMQCDENKCFCVNPKTGEVKDASFAIPLGEKYDCTKKKAGKCEKARFAELLSENPPSCSLECNAKGKAYKKKQSCNGEYWCVRKKTGKEVKNTRTTNKKLQCEK